MLLTIKARDAATNGLGRHGWHGLGEVADRLWREVGKLEV